MLLATGLLTPVVAAPAGAQTPPVVDYDTDDDGLIEVSSLAQLNAIRWDLDGDGTADVYPADDDGNRAHDPDGATKLAAAFPNAVAGMGCPSSGCVGYELAADLDFDTNGNGSADSGDDFWNGGKGWAPLMGGEAIYGEAANDRFDDYVGGRYLGERPRSKARMFTGIFEGNGRTIANLHIDRPGRWYVGLFGFIGPGGHVRNFGLSAPNADSGVRGGTQVGAMAAQVEMARVSGVWSEVDVSGDLDVGGLIGRTRRESFVVESYATGDVTGANVGGLVGIADGSGIAAVYATGDVAGSGWVGGLAGFRWSGHVRAAYATGSVTFTGVPYSYVVDDERIVRSRAGGLIALLTHAWEAGWPRSNYATGQVSGPDGTILGGLTAGCWGADRPRAEGGNYWDTDASGLAASPDCGVGYTTAQLQAPTGYTGIYSGWNVDVDVGGYHLLAPYGGAYLGPGDDPWDFGTSTEYPVLKYCADKPGIDTADGSAYCPLQPDSQRLVAAVAQDSPPDVADDDMAGYVADPVVVAKVESLAAQTQHGSAHVNRWNRVLVAFGVHDGVGVSGGAMTAAQAQQMADAHSSPVWDEVVAELTALEAAPQQTPPPPPPPPPVPVVSITGSSGGTEGSPVTFIVTASPAPSADLALGVTVAASGDFGFGTAPTSVTVPSSGSVTVTVTTVDDDVDEPDGSVSLTLNAGSGYTVGSPATETATVADDDDPVGEQTGYTVDADVVAKVQNLAAQTQHGTAHVNRWQRVLVAFGEHDGSGVTGGAMTADEAQQMADAHSSPVWDEVVVELAALQTATQTTPPPPPPPPPPPLPAVSITSSSGGIEGDPATFALTASPPPTADLTVSVTVAATGDFGAAVGSRTVTIPTSGTATVTVATADDDTDEPDGQVTLTLNTGSGYTVGSPSTETAAVSDDDPPVVPVVSITAGGDVTEGDSITFTLTASPPPAGPLDVTATVTAAGDWGAAAGQRTVTIPASGTATLTVATADDHTDEPDGTITATLNSGDGYTVSATQRAATVSVADDDMPDVSITAAGGVTEGGSITFTLTASPPPAGPLDVTATIAAAGDWGVTAGQRTVTVPASGTATLTVATADDHTDEADGTITATIAAGSGYTVSATHGTATASVADDDPPPVEQDQPDQPDQPDQAPLAACDGRPTLLISSPQASRHDTAVDFEVSLSCIPAGRPTILLSPLRDGNLSRNIFVHLSADQTSTTVTVAIGTEHQLALVLAWNTGLANHQAQGNVTYTD